MLQRRLPCLLALLSLALGACGEDRRLSREDFVSRANALCRENDRRIARVVEDVVARSRRRRAGPSEDELRAEVLNRSVPITRSLLGRLRELRPPEEDEARVDDFLEQIETATDLVSELDRAFREGDRAKLTELTTRLAELAGPSRRFAQDYGLKDCLPEAGRA